MLKGSRTQNEMWNSPTNMQVATMTSDNNGAVTNNSGNTNTAAEEGMKKFLAFLLPEDLFLLVKTTTQGLLSASRVDGRL